MSAVSPYLFALAVVCVAPPYAPNLNDRIANIVPKPTDEKWASAGWRTDVMAARLEAQKVRKPLFLWIMVGNPQGCT